LSFIVFCIIKKYPTLLYSTIGQSLKNDNSIEITKILPSIDKVKSTTANAATDGTKSATTIINPVDPIAFKFLYAKENQKLEIHMELEWTPGK
jgi:hypothetical protein